MINFSLLLSEEYWVEKIELLASYMPLEAFVFLGSLLEEMIAPIPSPVVMTLAGITAFINSTHILQIIIVILLASVGKTLGSIFLYWLGDKFEDQLGGKLGAFFGLNHKTIESIGSRISGGAYDNFLVFITRAIPIIPSSIISVGLGVIKINLKTYIIYSFFGFIVRATFYFITGYFGVSSVKFLKNPVFITITLLILGILGIIFIFKLAIKSKKISEFELKFIKEIKGIDIKKIGKRLSFGFLDNVYEYDKNRVIKIPKKLGLIIRSDGKSIKNSMEFAKKYYSKYLLESEVLTDSKNNNHVIIQERLENYKHLSWDNSKTVYKKVIELLQLNKEVGKKEGKTIDLWGVAGVLSWFGVVIRNYAEFTNIAVVEGKKDKEIYIFDNHYTVKGKMGLFLNTFWLWLNKYLS